MNVNKSEIFRIITECLSNPKIKPKITKTKGLSFDQERMVEKELSRVFGYCILFKSNDGIEEYMALQEEQKQIQYLKEKIAQKIGIEQRCIVSEHRRIIEYIYENFRKKGYVFHAANSKSVEDKLKNGLNGEVSNSDHKNELMKIAEIYKKYGRDNPLGWGTIDIVHDNSGWFYDDCPKNITYYADSPEWFNQFCGEQGIYSSLISEEKRHGYRNRDHATALETVTALIDKKKMSQEDKTTIIEFFNKCWKKFEEAKPSVILVPYSEVVHLEKPNLTEDKDLETFMNFYSDDDGEKRLFKDIISCKCSLGINKCCKGNVEPQNLVAIDLSPVLPRYKIERLPIRVKCIKQVDIDTGANFERTCEGTIIDINDEQELAELMAKYPENFESIDMSEEDWKQYICREAFDCSDRMDPNSVESEQMINMANDALQASNTEELVEIYKDVKKAKEDLDKQENEKMPIRCKIIGDITGLNIGEEIEFQKEEFEKFAKDFPNAYKTINMTRDDWVNFMTARARKCESKIGELGNKGINVESRHASIIPDSDEFVDGTSYGDGLPNAYIHLCALEREIALAMGNEIKRYHKITKDEIIKVCLEELITADVSKINRVLYREIYGGYQYGI